MPLARRPSGRSIKPFGNRIITQCGCAARLWLACPQVDLDARWARQSGSCAAPRRRLRQETTMSHPRVFEIQIPLRKRYKAEPEAALVIDRARTRGNDPDDP